MALNRIYTRRGDAGETGLVGGQRVPKDSPRIEAAGAVDELNACVGLASVSCAGDARLAPLAAILARVQHEIFNLGSILATEPQDVHAKQARVTAVEVARLEREIDAMNADLTALRSFVLPGGTALAAHLHLCRTVSRRAERLVVELATLEAVGTPAVKYLNRLSDWFFVAARVANDGGQADVLWVPGANR